MSICSSRAPQLWTSSTNTQLQQLTVLSEYRLRQPRLSTSVTKACLQHLRCNNQLSSGKVWFSDGSLSKAQSTREASSAGVGRNLRGNEVSLPYINNRFRYGYRGISDYRSSSRSLQKYDTRQFNGSGSSGVSSKMLPNTSLVSAGPRSSYQFFRSSNWYHVRSMRMRNILLRQSKSEGIPRYPLALRSRSRCEGCAVLDRIFADKPSVYSKLHQTSRPKESNGSFRSSLGRFYYAWFPALAVISSFRLKVYPPYHPLSPKKLKFDFERYIRKKLRRASRGTAITNVDILDIWRSLGPRRRRRMWMSMLLYTLHHDLLLALQILSAILKDRQEIVPNYVLADCIAMVCHEILEMRSLEQADNYNSDANPTSLCLQLANQYLVRYPALQLDGSFTPHMINLIAQKADAEQLSLWTQNLRRTHTLGSSTLLNLAILLSKHGKADLALNLLRAIPRETISLRKTTIACTIMLSTDIPSQQAYVQRINLLTAMLELGVRPDERFRDAIIRIAVQGGDHDLAWQTYEEAVKNGLAPTVPTYIYLLKSIQNPNDMKTVFWIYREAEKAGLVQDSVGLGAALIRALYTVLLAQDGSNRRFDTLLETYSRIFDLQPLREVGIVQNHSPAGTGKISPNRRTLQRMLDIWISECYEMEQLQMVYQRWKGVTNTGASKMTLTADSPNLIRAFSVQFSRLGDKDMSFQIIRSFLRDQLPNYSGLEKSVAARRQGVLPQRLLEKANVKECTAIINAFTTRGEMDEAEHVLRLMQDRGFQPDGVVFELLLLGYARKQNIKHAVRTLLQKQNAGFEANDWTMRAMGKVEDRAALRRALLAAEFRSTQRGIEDQPLQVRPGDI